MSEKNILVLEGSECLQIEHATGPMDDHPLWVSKYLVQDPDVVKKMHRDYLEAGSDILKSLTYQVSVQDLVKVYGVSVEKAIEIIQSAVVLARQTWSEYKKESGSTKKERVCGSVGAYGALQHDGSEYTGKYVEVLTEEMLIDWHRPRVQALVSAGVDFLCCETLPSIVEARALLKLLREFPNTKAWVSFTCKEGNKTAHGDPFGQCVSECWNLGREQLVAVGLNCTQPTLVTDLLQAAKAAINGPCPFVVYPNSGEHFDVEAGSWAGERMDLGNLATSCLNLGTQYIGGCCRTDVRDIRRIREVVNSY